MRLRRHSRWALGLSVLTLGLLGGALSTAGTAAAAPPAGYSSFKDSFTLTTGANQMVPVARLRLPAGSYAIFAKLFLGPPLDGLGQTVRCDLVAGSDFDRVFVSHDGAIAFTSVALNVVHRFPEPTLRFPFRLRLIQLNCGFLFAPGSVSLGFVKITAISLDSLSNAPSL